MQIHPSPPILYYSFNSRCKTFSLIQSRILSSSPLTCAQRYIILPPAPHTLSPLEKHASGNLLDNQKQCFLSELNKWLFILKDRFHVKMQLSIIIFFSEQSKEGFSLVWGMLHMSWLFFLSWFHSACLLLQQVFTMESDYLFSVWCEHVCSQCIRAPNSRVIEKLNKWRKTNESVLSVSVLYLCVSIVFN